MTKVLDGVRVLEVASHVFVPIAGVVLGDWGATVTKIEHPVTGDDYRGLVTQGIHRLYNGINPAFQGANRGKRSVGLDLKSETGREVLYRLAKDHDVFLTNMREPARQRLHIDVDDIRAHNPNMVYVRGTGYGIRGPDAARAGFDSAAYFARSGVANALTAPGADWPVKQRPAFGDVMGGLTIAGSIAAALYHREKTGEGSVIDVSLLGVGMWQVQADIINAGLHGESRPRPDRKAVVNPVVNVYKTKDGRFIGLNMLDAERHWANFCATVGRPELTNDERFKDMPSRRANAEACVTIIDEIFAEKTYAEWKVVLGALTGAWAPYTDPVEVLDDPQVMANGYLQPITMIDGTDINVVANPSQFDEQPGHTERAPEHGEHTEAVLLEAGYTWEDIAELKKQGAIL